MDPEIYQTVTSLLRNLHKVRKDSAHPKSKYEEATSLPLRHPKSVIVVTSKTKRQFPSLVGEIARVHRLDAALYQSIQIGHEVTRISIVVDEGTYVDNIQDWKFPASLELDIVGMRGVICVSLEHRIRIKDNTMFITNVQIVDSAVKSEVAMVTIDGKSRLHFTDVRFTMNSTEDPAMQILGQGTKATFSDCLIEGGHWGFFINDAALVEFSKCLLRNIPTLAGNVNSSSFSASNTRFENCGQLKLTNNADASLQSCYFKGNASKAAAIAAHSQSKLFLQETLIEKYPIAVFLQRHSKAELTKCSILSCHDATQVLYSSNLEIRDSKIMTQRILRTFSNEKGHIVFKRNTILNNMQPILSMDQELPTSNLSHDFPHGSVKIELYHREQLVSDAYRFDKQQRLSSDNPDKRICKRCYICETGTDAETKKVEGRFKKFKLCKNCKKVRYCSEKCQKDDWSDHKAVCRIFHEKIKQKSAI